MWPKKVVILGSTGSIGINTLKVIERFPDKFKVVGLTAYSNHLLLEKQIKKFCPSHVAVSQKGINYLKKNIDTKKVKILNVDSDLKEIVSLKSCDIVVLAMTGSIALEPFIEAIRCSKTIATANKEALVIAGDIIIREAKKHAATIIPIDSEQSAIFQCIEGMRDHPLAKVYLTASGGTLWKVPKSKFDKLSVDQILNHPRWKMGKRITVDSATLMNKGFEVIEAMRLFDLNVGSIEVVIHPQAIIHSMVEFEDGSIIAQLGITDMRLPIQYALTYPHRWKTNLGRVDFSKIKTFNFEKPDYKKFPCLALAIDVAKKGGTLPSVLNAADEEAVEAFLNQKIKFSSIYRIVEKIVSKHKVKKSPDLKDILATEQWAREQTRKVIYN